MKQLYSKVGKPCSFKTYVASVTSIISGRIYYTVDNICGQLLQKYVICRCVPLHNYSNSLINFGGLLGCHINKVQVNSLWSCDCYTKVVTQMKVEYILYSQNRLITVPLSVHVLGTEYGVCYIYENKR
jgi:hypothetical protein